GRSRSCPVRSGRPRARRVWSPLAVPRRPGGWLADRFWPRYDFSRREMVFPIRQLYRRRPPAMDPTTDTEVTDTDMTVPAHSRYVIIGAGIHGLSTGWHLATELRRRGLGGGEDILILDKTGIGAGASGIACGVIRNNYFQPAMRELMAHSVSVWESDPEAFAYSPVGYMQIAPEDMHH